jgi:hypothetical protein
MESKGFGTGPSGCNAIQWRSISGGKQVAAELRDSPKGRDIDSEEVRSFQ